MHQSCPNCGSFKGWRYEAQQCVACLPAIHRDPSKKDAFATAMEEACDCPDIKKCAAHTRCLKAYPS